MQQEHLSLLIEEIKLMADYLKHISTLSTGAVLLLTIFLEKIFVKPHRKHLVVIAFGGFAGSLIGSVIAFTGLLYPLSVMLTGGPDPGDAVWLIGFSLTLTGFLVGIVSLSIFAISNLRKDMASESATQV